MRLGIETVALMLVIGACAAVLLLWDKIQARRTRRNRGKR